MPPTFINTRTQRLRARWLFSPRRQISPGAAKDRWIPICVWQVRQCHAAITDNCAKDCERVLLDVLEIVAQVERKLCVIVVRLRAIVQKELAVGEDDLAVIAQNAWYIMSGADLVNDERAVDR
eukprot:2584473-Heterocapsa_arctica.AAC.1